MKREELTAYDCNEGSYDSMGFPWGYKEMVYDKDQADKVMDDLEAQVDVFRNANAILIKRVQELEDECNELEQKLEDK